MNFKKLSHFVGMASFAATAFCMPSMASAQSDDDQLAALADCLHTCQVAYAGTGYTAGYNQCVSSCIERYDGGYGNGGGDGTTPIGPGAPCGRDQDCWYIP